MRRKQVKSILLTLILTFALTGASFAVPYTDIDNNPHSDAILEMSRLGILEGVGNNQFAPLTELNRAAAARVAGQLLGYTEADAALAAQAESIFVDVEGTRHAWALGWINLMAQDDILKGVGNDRYAPGDPLQMVHWAAILTRILQHESEPIVWPNSYNELANRLGLDQGLYYMGSNIMNRAEMARMTTTALYLIERPDGKRIIDIVTFTQEPLDGWHVSEQGEPIIYSEAEIELQLSNAIVPPGGGQKITIKLTATHGPNNTPAVNTTISFFANAGEEDRNAQLSAREVTTDANGKVSVTYTTLSADDNKQLRFLANIYTDGEWLDRNIYAMASETVALISGRVINPFNGEPATNVNVGILLSNNPESYTPIDVDSKGYFSSPVNSGTYDVNIELNTAGTVPHAGSFKGSHFTINENGDIRITIQNQNFTNGNSYTIPTEMGIITGVTDRPAGSEIYITRKSDQVTQIAQIGANGRFMISLSPGSYVIYNNVGTALKDNITILKGNITDVGTF